MKYITTIVLAFLSTIAINAQQDSLQLLPDQNPNFRKSRDKYMAQASELTKNEGVTIQQTYKAIDDVQAKKERKELASARRQERRMARIQSRGYRRSGGYYGYNNYSYYPYSNNSYGYGYNRPRWNYGYNNNYGYGYNNQPYYRSPIQGTVNTVIGGALLGLTLWSIFGR